MSTTTSRSSQWFAVTKEEVLQLFESPKDAAGLTKFILYFVGVFLTPITVIGAIWGYVRAYNRFFRYKDLHPNIGRLQPIARVAMFIGAVLIWAILYIVIFQVFGRIAVLIWGEHVASKRSIIVVLLMNSLLTFITLVVFAVWRARISNTLFEKERYGTARWARHDDMIAYIKPKGFYIGGGYYRDESGHIFTCAGPRGGKGTCLIIPNLLMPELAPEMSWVVIDPKGENAAVTKTAQRAAGRKVVFLNPWNMHDLGGSSYNPLDLLKHDRLHLVDDIEVIAEAIVPFNAGKGQNSGDHFDTRARSYISGLLLYLVTEADEEDKHLGTIWKWLRYSKEQWNDLFASMMTCYDDISGETIRATASEMLSLSQNSEREYSSILSTAQKHTDFIKSPAMQETLKATSDFSSSDLRTGNTTVYLIIPADKLKSHSQWLRLVTCSLMRSVVRKPGKKTCFLLDESYALGYMSEIDIALGLYAGYGVHVWSIFQSLSQVQALYGDNWENFIASCSVKHFFNISDNMSANYVSTMFGTSSVLKYDATGNASDSTARPLIMPDELRKQSGENIFAIIDQKPPLQMKKWAYFDMNLQYDPNPFFQSNNEPDAIFSQSKKPSQKSNTEQAATPSSILTRID